jgi:hypothetical protein
MQERDICYVVWKARKTDEDKARLKEIRRVVKIDKNIKKILPYMAKFLNPYLPSKTLWKNLNHLCAENTLDTAPVIFSLNDLNSFYSSDTKADLPDPNNLSSVPNSSDLFVFRTVPLVCFNDFTFCLISRGSSKNLTVHVLTKNYAKFQTQSL